MNLHPFDDVVANARERLRAAAIPISYLRACLDYDAENGALTWRFRPRDHFRSDGEYRRWNSRYAGNPAGWMNHGYCKIGLTHDETRYSILVHCAAFALMKGAWPTIGLDHHDRDPANNRWANLREATDSQNLQNSGLRSDNSSGVTGVSFDKSNGKWRAHIALNGKRIWRGSFARKEDAIQHRREAELELHPFAPTSERERARSPHRDRRRKELRWPSP